MPCHLVLSVTVGYYAICMSFFFQFLALLGASGAQFCLLTLALSHTMCTIGYYAIRMFIHSHMIICHQALANKEPPISCVL